MKIYIVGSVASGKTTLAKKLEKELNTPCIHLDSIVHIKDKSNKEWGNIRRDDVEISRLFNEVIHRDNWIVEDAGRRCFKEAMEKADRIIHLKPSINIRRKRIISRYIKQKLGIEESLYRPSIKMLKFMFRALNNYEIGKDDLEKRLQEYKEKVLLIRNRKDLKYVIKGDVLNGEGKNL